MLAWAKAAQLMACLKPSAYLGIQSEPARGALTLTLMQKASNHREVYCEKNFYTK